MINSPFGLKMGQVLYSLSPSLSGMEPSIKIKSIFNFALSMCSLQYYSTTTFYTVYNNIAQLQNLQCIWQHYTTTIFYIEYNNIPTTGFYTISNNIIKLQVSTLYTTILLKYKLILFKSWMLWRWVLLPNDECDVLGNRWWL